MNCSDDMGAIIRLQPVALELYIDPPPVPVILKTIPLFRRITVANGNGAARTREVAANGRCGLQRARLDRAEPPGPAPEVQN